MKIFISTGEVSGDLQGAMLVKSLYKVAASQKIDQRSQQAPSFYGGVICDLEIAGLGGERMKTAGAKILADTSAIGSMGFVEAIPFILPTIKIQNLTKKYLRENPPDILVLIDYPAANLALASYVKQHLPQVPIVYYIAPQDWAVPMLDNTVKIARLVDKLLAIFPQEADYFSQQNIDVTWVGHPLLDRMQQAPDRTQARLNLEIEPEARIITLLPASRWQEIKSLLPVMCEAARQITRKFPEVEFLIPVSLPSYRPAITAAVAEYNLPARVIDGQTLDAIASADLAITKSGTVNLEIALLNVPQVVVYRIHPLTAWIGRRLGFSVPLMSPPNLVVNRKIVPELQQEEVTADRIADEATKLLSNSEIVSEIALGYDEMRSLLGTTGVGDRVAVEIIKLANGLK